MSTTAATTESFILFDLAGTTYALRSRAVQQVEMIDQITPMPNAPPFIEGVVFSRGQVIPALNLRQRFGFPKAVHDLRSRLIVLHSCGRTVGVVVDTAREFVPIAPEAIHPPPDSLDAQSDNYLDGVARIGTRLVLIVDETRLLQAAEVPTPMPSIR